MMSEDGGKWDRVEIERSYYRNEGDYVGDDNTLRCGECHDEKESWWGGLPSERECKCMLERAEAKKQKAIVGHRRHECFENSRVLYECTFGTVDCTAPEMQKVKRYADNFQEMFSGGMGLKLWGANGNGKTTAAACIANAWNEIADGAFMTSFGRILSEVFSIKDKSEYFDELVSYPLLIIDDLGAERSSEYAQEIVFNVIDGRYRTGKPLIVTTNLTLDEIKNPADMRHARIYDRLLEMCIPIHFAGPSRRREIQKQKIETMRTLLEGDGDE